jgi:hypothetical protein
MGLNITPQVVHGLSGSTPMRFVVGVGTAGTADLGASNASTISLGFDVTGRPRGARPWFLTNCTPSRRCQRNAAASITWMRL